MRGAVWQFFSPPILQKVQSDRKYANKVKRWTKFKSRFVQKGKILEYLRGCRRLENDHVYKALAKSKKIFKTLDEFKKFFEKKSK